MKTRTRVFLAMSILLAPIAWGVGEQLYLHIGSLEGEWGVEMVTRELEAIAANHALWSVTSYIFYLAALATIPALVAIWRLSVGRAPRWAWAGAIIATMGVFGQAVHLMGSFGLNGALASYGDHAAAAEILVHAHAYAFANALFVPYMLGFLAIIPQAVGLRRARVIPIWAAACLVASLPLLLVVESTPLTSAIWLALATVGFAPAAVAMLRDDPELPVVAPPASSPAPVPTSA